jgi:hypothetical protein
MATTTPDPISRMSMKEIPLLSTDECARTRTGIHALREEWTRWRWEAPHFTLGAASSYDVKLNDFPQYQEKARRLNPLLHERFAWLYDRLLDALSCELGRPCFFDDDISLPGFQIFLGDEVFRLPVGNLHFDTQYEEIGWNRYPGADPEGQFSLTLAIRLPACGAGLWSWPLFHQDLPPRGLGEERWQFSLKGLERQHHPYTEGRMLLHSGHELHMVAAMPGMTEEDERLTLQAHALPTARGYLLYW